MPTASETRTLSMPAGDVWQLVSDPYHLPRWWPRVERVEGVQGPQGTQGGQWTQGTLFTQVLRSSSGRMVRADFELRERDEAQMRLVWAQQIAGTPFERVLSASQIDVVVRPRMGMNESAGSDVTLTLIQTLPRLSRSAAAASHPEPRLASSVGARRAGLPSSLFARLGSPMIRKAAVKTVKEALDGLERIAG
jgi:uncharacterized protein YndB with AHSA1/START domain